MALFDPVSITRKSKPRHTIIVSIQHRFSNRTWHACWSLICEPRSRRSLTHWRK